MLQIDEVLSAPSSAMQQNIEISITIPLMNEEQNIRNLHNKISKELNELKCTYEVIFVDDGSTDNTFEVLKQLHEENPETVCVIRFRRNFGKTPALVAGFSRSRGKIIFTMDGDLQDDPVEIPRFLEKLNEGYDLVSGWKFPRLDPLSKALPSRLFNGLVSKFTSVQLHDVTDLF